MVQTVNVRKLWSFNISLKVTCSPCHLMASCVIPDYHYFLILLTLLKKSVQKGKTWTIPAIISTVLNRSTRDVLLKHYSRQAGYALKKQISSHLIFTVAVLSVRAVKLEYVWLCPPTLACFSCWLHPLWLFNSHLGFWFFYFFAFQVVSKSTWRKLH